MGQSCSDTSQVLIILGWVATQWAQEHHRGCVPSSIKDVSTHHFYPVEDFMSSDISGMYQSGFRKNHSTERDTKLWMAENFSQLNQDQKLEQEPGKGKLDSKLQARSLKSMCDIWPRTQFWITCQGCHKKSILSLKEHCQKTLSLSDGSSLKPTQRRLIVLLSPAESIAAALFSLVALWIFFSYSCSQTQLHESQRSEGELTLHGFYCLRIGFLYVFVFLIRLFYWFIKLL